MQKFRSRSAFSISIFLLLLLMTFTACGPGSSGAPDSEALVKVSDFGRVFSIDDVLTTGWKRNKTYDVEGLDDAKEAYAGFWTPPELDPLDYEIRIYPDHRTAVDSGTPFAEEASGEGASLTVDDAMWDEGVRNRRMMVGPGSGTQTSRYGDFVILSNLVILCQGRNSEQALDHCAPFVALLRGKGA